MNSEITLEPLAKRGFMYIFTYSVMASFHASAATRPSEVLIRLKV